MDRDLKNQLTVLVVYIVVYALVVFLLTQPWRVKHLANRAQDEFDRLRGVVQERLSPAEEIMIREFRQKVSSWDHEQTQTRPRDH